MGGPWRSRGPVEQGEPPVHPRNCLIHRISSNFQRRMPPESETGRQNDPPRYHDCRGPLVDFLSLSTYCASLFRFPVVRELARLYRMVKGPKRRRAIRV
jgi:hypothetical protein